MGSEDMRSRLLLATALAASLPLLSAAPSASGTRACGASEYSYAGFQHAGRAHGVGSVITVLAAPSVREGHVAAWVGVGGVGLGPGGASEWIQVGLSAFSGSGQSSLYFEVTKPGQGPRYVEIEPAVAPGARRRVAVLEMAGRRNWWRVWVDGRAVSAPIHLPGSHGAWRPIATAESWNAGSRACNRFRYRFDRVSVAGGAGGAWSPFKAGYAFEDPGYRAVLRTRAAFLASARS
jgi:hypothetical protein